jgi:hypothetical protein
MLFSFLGFLYLILFLLIVNSNTIETKIDIKYYKIDNYYYLCYSDNVNYITVVVAKIRKYLMTISLTVGQDSWNKKRVQMLQKLSHR